MVSGVSSCYAVKPSALHKTRKAMSPCGSLEKAIIRRCPPPSPTRPDMGDEAAYLIVQPSGESSARHDKACTHIALAGNTTNHRHRQGPTWKTRLPTSSSSRQGKIMHDTSKHARTPHAQPRRITASANNDNADSTSQMNKSRETIQELHKSAMSPLALAGITMHRLMD